MSFSSHTEREWLTEDLEQIRRFFPGATITEVIDTPFYIETGVMSQETRGRAVPLRGKSGNPVKNPPRSDTASTLNSYILTPSSGGLL